MSICATMPTLLAAALAAAALPAQGFAELTAKLARAETCDDAMVGYDGARSETFRTYERWRALATVAELRSATSHANPVVRCYAVRALVETEAAFDPVALIKARLQDAAKVTTFSGCCLAEQKVGDVVFGMLRPKLSDEALLDVAEALVENDSPLDARATLLRTLRLRDGMLHRVRALAEDGDAPALIALARYRLPVDLPLVTKALPRSDPFAHHDRWRAAAAYPDPSLLPLLLRYEGAARDWLAGHNAFALRSWLGAIAAQRSAGAAAFLTRFFDENVDGGRSPYDAQHFRESYRDVQKPHADCEHYAALRERVR